MRTLCLWRTDVVLVSSPLVCLSTLLLVVLTAAPTKCLLLEIVMIRVANTLGIKDRIQDLASVFRQLFLRWHSPHLASVLPPAVGMRSVAVSLLLAGGCSARKEHAANLSAMAQTLLAPGEAVLPADIPFTACTDVDTSVPQRRSTLGGFCCKFCGTGANREICCPSHEYVSDGGAEVSAEPRTQAHLPPPPPQTPTALPRPPTQPPVSAQFERRRLCFAADYLAARG